MEVAGGPDHATIGTSCIEVLIHATFLLLSWFTSYGDVK